MTVPVRVRQEAEETVPGSDDPTAVRDRLSDAQEGFLNGSWTVDDGGPVDSGLEPARIPPEGTGTMTDTENEEMPVMGARTHPH